MGDRNGIGCGKYVLVLKLLSLYDTTISQHQHGKTLSILAYRFIVEKFTL